MATHQARYGSSYPQRLIDLLQGWNLNTRIITTYHRKKNCFLCCIALYSLTVGNRDYRSSGQRNSSQRKSRSWNHRTVSIHLSPQSTASSQGNKCQLTSFCFTWLGPRDNLLGSSIRWCFLFAWLSLPFASCFCNNIAMDLYLSFTVQHTSSGPRVLYIS